MEQKNINNKTIKITLLEIKPSLNELDKNNNEISIIFQGINVFYNLSKLISNNTEILINNCKNSLIMSLIKCDNIFASALFNINPGENWVTFNYESKNKSKMKQNMNNIDCIKIKIFCEYKNKRNILSNMNNKSQLLSNDIKNKNSKMKINNLLSNNNNKPQLLSSSINNNKKIKRYHTNYSIIGKKQSNNKDLKNHLRYDSIITESNRYINSINSNKYNYNTPLNKNYTSKMIMSDIILNRNDISKEKLFNHKNNENSLNTYNHKRLNSSSSNHIKNSIGKNKKNNFHSHRINNKKKSKLKFQINVKNFDNLDNYLESNSVIQNHYKTDNDKIHINKNEINNSNNCIYVNHSPLNSERGGHCLNSGNEKDLNNLFFGYNQNSKNKNKNSENVQNRQIIKNRLFKNNIQGNVTNSYSTATTKKNEFDGSLNSFQDNDEKKNKKKNKKYKHPLTTQRQKIKQNSYHIQNKSQYQLMIDNNINMNKNTENINTMNSLDNNLNDKEENSIQYLRDIDDKDDIDLDDFSGLKTDLELLYNPQYIKNIKNDLLTLEIELFAEKMIELISIYHREIKFKIKENLFTKNIYKENIKKYQNLLKLNNKLQLIKNNFISKDIYLNNNNKVMMQQKTNNLLLNKEEFGLFHILINSKIIHSNTINNININKNLKEILYIIVNNNKNKKLIEDNFKINILLQNLIINDNNSQQNKKIRTKAIPKKQHTKILSKINNFNNFEINNDINIITNSYNNCNTDAIYIKKGAKSPIYSQKKMANQIKYNI